MVPKRKTQRTQRGDAKNAKAGGGRKEKVATESACVNEWAEVV